MLLTPHPHCPTTKNHVDVDFIQLLYSRLRCLCSGGLIEREVNMKYFARRKWILNFELAYKYAKEDNNYIRKMEKIAFSSLAIIFFYIS
jgi:hypothetical protein